VLAHFGLPRPTHRGELAATKPKHDAVIRKADRVIEDYRRLDGALRIVVKR
jgi:hypothetical protein